MTTSPFSRPTICHIRSSVVKRISIDNYSTENRIIFSYTHMYIFENVPYMFLADKKNVLVKKSNLEKFDDFHSNVMVVEFPCTWGRRKSLM